MQKQLHIKLDEGLHRNIRVQAAELGQSIQEYVVNTLQIRAEEQLALYNFKKPKVTNEDRGDFVFIDLFAGIGGMRKAFENAGGQCAFTSEWNEYSKKVYFDNFGDMPHGDITKIDENSIPDHDVLVAGFPCQPFSIAGVSKKNSLGKKHGFLDKTQGTLFFDIARILKAKRPKMFLLENVKNLARHDRGSTFQVILDTLRELDYNVTHEIVDACNYVPQHRERIYIVGMDRHFYGAKRRFDFPEHSESKPSIREILEECVPPKYTLSDHLWTYLKNYAAKHRAKGNGFGFGLVDLDGIARTLSARYYKDGSEILIPQKNKNPRRLTPRECARLMGFDDDFKITVSDTQAYKQFGNSVAVPVVTTIARAIAMQLPKQVAVSA